MQTSRNNIRSIVHILPKSHKVSYSPLQLVSDKKHCPWHIAPPTYYILNVVQGFSGYRLLRRRGHSFQNRVLAIHQGGTRYPDARYAFCTRSTSSPQMATLQYYTKNNRPGQKMYRHGYLRSTPAKLLLIWLVSSQNKGNLQTPAEGLVEHQPGLEGRHKREPRQYSNWDKNKHPHQSVVKPGKSSY